MPTYTRSRAWMIALGAFLCRFLNSGLSKSYGVLLPTLTEQFNIMVWSFGNTISLMSISGAFVVVLVSPLMKKIYPRYLLIMAGFITASGLILASFAGSWTLISFLLICLTGVGTRCSLTFTISVLPKYFDQHLLLACGFAYAGGPVGTMVFAPLTQWWLDMFGWRATLLLLGTSALNMIICGAVVKPQPEKSEDKGIEKQKAEQFSCGFTGGIIDCFDLVLFKDFDFMALMICDFSLCVAWTGWLIYLIPHGEQKGLTPYQSSALATAGGAGFLIGLMIPAFVVKLGILTDTQVRFISFVVCGVTFIVDPWVNTFLGLMLLSIVCTGAIGVGYITSIVIAKNVNVGNMAQVVAFSLFVSAAGHYAGGTLTGLLFDISGSYDISFVVLGSFQLAAAVIQSLAILLKRRRRLTL